MDLYKDCFFNIYNSKLSNSLCRIEVKEISEHFLLIENNGIITNLKFVVLTWYVLLL